MLACLYAVRQCQSWQTSLYFTHAMLLQYIAATFYSPTYPPITTIIRSSLLWYIRKYKNTRAHTFPQMNTVLILMRARVCV